MTSLEISRHVGSLSSSTGTDESSEQVDSDRSSVHRSIRSFDDRVQVLALCSSTDDELGSLGTSRNGCRTKSSEKSLVKSEQREECETGVEEGAGTYG